MTSVQRIAGIICITVGIGASFCFGPGFIRPVLGDEPYQKFLQKLRDERLFDLALVYLEELESEGELTPLFRAEIELERGLLLFQSAAVLSASNSERGPTLDAAEQSIRDFLEKRTRHPRRGEARLKLGELLLTRAEEAVRRSEDDPNQNNAEAIKFYDEAHKLFESTITELAGIYENIKGARTDPNDKPKVAYRQRVQQDLRQAQLLSAKSVDDRGRSRAENSKERKADLEKALKMFSDLYSKEQRMIGVRNYSLFYRSALHAELGRPGDAIDGFQRIADLEGVDVLRPLQTDAIKELTRLLAAQGKFPLAVDRADKWIAGLRPDERNLFEVVELKLELSKTKLAWAEQLKKKDPDDRVASRLVRDTRTDLRSLLRVPGSHLEETQDILATLGVEVGAVQSSELPEVKDFGEAVAEAQQRIDQSETDALGLAVMREKGQIAQAKAAEAAINLAQMQALELLREAIRLYGPDDDRGLLNDVRFRIAYLLLKQQRPSEAMAIAEFLAYMNPGTERGLNAAAVNLGAYSDLLRTAGEDEQNALTDMLEPFAEYLVATWPASAEASAAASALVQLSLARNAWDNVDKYLNLVPGEGDAAAQLRRDAGLTYYAKYIEEKKLSGESSDASKKLKSRAIESLKIGVQSLKAEQLDGATIEAVNSLVRLLLADGQLAEAAELLLNSPQSPIKALKANPKAAVAKTAMESYRTAIQVIVSRLAAGELDSKDAIQETQAYIKSLQELSDASPDGKVTLARIFVGLAQDLNEQLGETKEPGKRTKLIEALVLISVEASKSDSFNTQHWAVETILGVADELMAGRKNRPLAQKSYADAAEILEQILAKDEATPGWIDPAGLKVQIHLLLARAEKGLGNYKGSIDVLAKILTETNNMLDVQMEAARTYQAWGDSANSGFHKVALLGGRVNPKTNQKLIWGWGKISQMTASQPDFSEQFYESRFELARSRYKYGAGLADATQKQQWIERAEKDITSTATLYPQLGGAVRKKQFDLLLKQIQKELGKPQQGLAALNTNG